MKKQVTFHVHLTGTQKSTLAIAFVFIILIAAITSLSPTVKLATFGLFCQVLGTVVIGLGLAKTNDELAELASHHEKFDKQGLITHLTRERFFITTGIFLMTLGLLFQIISSQFLT